MTDLSKMGDPFPGKTLVAITLSCDETAFELRATFDDETEFGTTRDDSSHSVARAALDALTREYLDVIRRLDDDGITSARAEALDMAKKVVHDDASKRLSALIPGFARDHEHERRLFSLAVALSHDTTKLAMAHRHR